MVRLLVQDTGSLGHTDHLATVARDGAFVGEVVGAVVGEALGGGGMAFPGFGGSRDAQVRSFSPPGNWIMRS